VVPIGMAALAGDVTTYGVKKRVTCEGTPIVVVAGKAVGAGSVVVPTGFGGTAARLEGRGSTTGSVTSCVAMGSDSLGADLSVPGGYTPGRADLATGNIGACEVKAEAVCGRPLQASPTVCILNTVGGDICCCATATVRLLP